MQAYIRKDNSFYYFSHPVSEVIKYDPSWDKGAYETEGSFKGLYKVHTEITPTDHWFYVIVPQQDVVYKFNLRMIRGNYGRFRLIKAAPNINLKILNEV